MTMKEMMKSHKKIDERKENKNRQSRATRIGVLVVLLFVVILFVAVVVVVFDKKRIATEPRRKLLELDPRTVESKTHPPRTAPPKQPSSKTTSTNSKTKKQQDKDPTAESAADNATQPSFVRLCTELVNRHEGKTPADELFVVHESPLVCETDESFAALSIMMLSSMLAQAGAGYRLSYQHGCGCHDTLEETASIQQWLPLDLTFGVGVTAEAMASRCSICLPQQRHLVECMGFPNPGQLPEPSDPMLASFRIAGFRHNIQHAVQRIQQQSNKSYGGAVILLDLESEITGRSWAYPMSYYRHVIPKDVSSITVLITQRCIDGLMAAHQKENLCRQHGQFLAEKLQKEYPSATIRGEILKGTAIAYARILNAPLLVCPPTLFCLLPVLYQEYSRVSYLSTKNLLYPWFQYIARENRKLMGKSIFLSPEGEVPTMSVTTMERLKPFVTDTPYQPPPNMGGTHLRHRRLTAIDPKTVVYKQPDVAVLPSYVALCHEVVARHARAPAPENLFVVHEQEHVCHSDDSFASITTMVLSSMVAQAASSLRVSYQHGCTPTEDLSTATIQQMMPSQLTLGVGIGLDVVHQMCQTCLQKTVVVDESNKHLFVQCMGIPTEEHYNEPLDPMLVSFRFAAFRHNVQAAVQTVRAMEQRGDSPFLPSNSGAVVYLDRVSDANHQTWILPVRYYAEVIPRHVSTILLLVSQRCDYVCRDYALFVANLLHEAYPRALIRVEMVRSSAVAYARVMEANHLVCPPNLFCLWPTLFREYSQTNHLTHSDRFYPWFFYLARENRKLMSKRIDLQKRIPAQRLDDTRLETIQDSFLLQPPPQEDGTACLALRGRVGGWVQDADYAQVAQYATPLKRFREFPTFEPTAEHPFRTATTYRWHDALCPVNLVTRPALCDVMRSLSLNRIYFVGDSLSMQMAQSLWKLLGHEDDPVIRGPGWQQWMRFQWDREIQCPNGHHLELVYTRNDLLDGNMQEFRFDKIGESFNCAQAEYCMPWIRPYADYHKGNTLLVANVGSHVHDVATYHTTLDNFLGLLDQHPKPNDLVVFRTTVPGHEGCQDPNVRPFSKHDEFAQELVADFRSWHLFPQFNDIVEEAIYDRKVGAERRGQMMEVLDVYPMTVLRKDGHTSGPEKCSTCKEDDCLHYILPGPIDWWNHLLYSNLVDLAQHIRATYQENQKQRQQQQRKQQQNARRQKQK